MDHCIHVVNRPATRVDSHPLVISDYFLPSASGSCAEPGVSATGGFGRVSVRVNTAGRVAFLKRMSVNSPQGVLHVRRQRRNMEQPTRPAEESSEDRVVRLVECISDSVEVSKSKADVRFVLQQGIASDLSEVGRYVVSQPNGQVQRRRATQIPHMVTWCADSFPG
jgi:hypothetical protein